MTEINYSRNYKKYYFKTLNNSIYLLTFYCNFFNCQFFFSYKFVYYYFQIDKHFCGWSLIVIHLKNYGLRIIVHKVVKKTDCVIPKLYSSSYAFFICNIWIALNLKLLKIALKGTTFRWCHYIHRAIFWIKLILFEENSVY